jgi:hypothetical protein
MRAGDRNILQINYTRLRGTPYGIPLVSVLPVKFITIYVDSIKGLRLYERKMEFENIRRRTEGKALKYFLNLLYLG